MKRNTHKSLLWRVTKEDGHSLLLFGSIHVATANIQEIVTHLYPYVLKANTFYAETDLDAMQAIQRDNQSEGQAVRDVLKKGKLKRLVQLMKPLGIPSEYLYSLHPLFIYQNIINLTLKDQSLIYPDHILWAYAKEHELKLDGIEDVHFQMDIYNTYDPFELKKMLIKAIDKPKNVKKELLRLINVYMDQDIHELQKRTKRSLGKMRKRLLFDRNNLMKNKIAHILDTDEKAFVVVGAGHLGGQKGILKLLKDSKYTITPIKINK